MADQAMMTVMTDRSARTHAIAIAIAIAATLGSGCERLRQLPWLDGAEADEVGNAEPAQAPDDASVEADAEAAAPAGDTSGHAADASAKPTGSVTRMFAAVQAAKPKLPVYGVVRDGTKMYTGPNTASPYLVAGGDDNPLPPHMRRYGYYHYGRTAPAEEEGPLGRAVRILALDGPLIEIENITVEDDVVTCAPLQPELAHVRVRLWVERDALVPVLDRPTPVALDEHSKITLAPGVPAFATDEEDKFKVRGDGITLEVRLPAAPSAFWHDPPAPMDPSGPVGSLGSYYAMTLRGASFPPMGTVGRQMGHLYGDAGGTSWVYADEIKGGDARVRVKNRCMDIEGVVVTDPRSSAPTSTKPMASRRRVLDKPPVVLAGTPVRWEDGTPAGIVVAPALFPGTKRSHGRDVCFGITSESGGPEVCFAADDAAAAPAGASEQDGLQVAISAYGVQSRAQASLNDELWAQYETVRGCFRKHVKSKVGHNYASANVSLQLAADGKVSVYWASAWTARGESRKLQRCIETTVESWTVDDPPGEAISLSLYLTATQS